MTSRTAFTTSGHILLVLLTGILLAACGGDGDGGSEAGSNSSSDGATVTMKGNSFDPASTSVKVGDTVTFENEDGHDHNVQGDGIDIGDFKSGSEEFTPEKAGTIEYECTLHDGMTGTLEVEDA